MKAHPHFDLESGSLLNGVALAPFFIQHHKIHDLRLFFPVFQRIRIYLKALPPVFFCSLALDGAFSLLYRILMDQELLVHIHHGFGRSLVQHLSFMEKDDPVTIFGNAAQVVADKKDGLSLGLKLFKFVVAFGLEEHIPHTQGLIHNEDLRIDIDSHRKSQPHKHTAGIGFHWLMNKLANISKCYDIV